MKIIMGADPAGFELKNAIKEDLLKRGYDVTDIPIPRYFSRMRPKQSQEAFRAKNTKEELPSAVQEWV